MPHASLDGLAAELDPLGDIRACTAVILCPRFVDRWC
jgi:hypothetical protein